MTMNTSETPSPVSRSFLIADLFTTGIDAICRQHSKLTPYTTEEILRGYTAMDEGYDEQSGAPRYDRHIWFALARQLFSAGAIDHASVMVQVDSTTSDENVPSRWAFYFDLKGCNEPFLTIDFAESETFDAEPTGFPVKAMGPAEKAGYLTRFGAYPMSVHPGLRERATSMVAFFIGQQLTQCGLLAQEIYHPEDTARDFARYYLTDGLTHCVMDFHGPRLVKALATIDRLVGRTEEDGGLVDDLSESSVPEEGGVEIETPADENEIEGTGDAGFEISSDPRLMVGKDNPDLPQ